MRKKMKKLVLVVALLAMMVVAATSLALSAATAHELTREPGPVGWRELPQNQGLAYCDNFYEGPPVATTPSGQPWKAPIDQQVYWCHLENKGHWTPVSPLF